MLRRWITAGLALASGLLFVDLALPWVWYGEGAKLTGWQTGVGQLAGFVAALLLGWEGARLIGVSSGWRHDGFVGFLLGLAGALLAFGAFVQGRWGYTPTITFRFAYGAWIGLGLAAVLLLCSAFRALEQRRITLEDGDAARAA